MSKVETVEIEDISMSVKIAKGQQAIEMIANTLIETLDLYKAANYIESKMESKDGESVAVAVYRLIGGNTPHQMRLEAEAHVLRLQRELSAANLEIMAKQYRIDSLENQLANLR